MTAVNMEFKQFDTNFDRFKYAIEDTGLRLIKKRIASSSETFVDFEDIGSKIIIEKSRKLLWLIISLLFLVIAISVFVKRLNGGNVGNGAEIFHISTSMFFLILYLITKRNIIHLTQSDNTNAIEFIGTKRYKKNVDDFIKELLQRRDKYLVDKYSTLNEFLPYDQQYNNLVWLYNLKLLTKEQLNIKINELDKIEFRTVNLNNSGLTKIIGFKNRSNVDEYNDDDNDE
ncbi:MAG: hypothetical protein IPJ43_15535 [Saprospiraceae bacterium]|nr:hypothetical protein [Saprospiraceae bacterium]